MHHVLSASVCHIIIKGKVVFFPGHDHLNPVHSITSQKTKILKIPAGNVVPLTRVCHLRIIFKITSCVVCLNVCFPN